MNDDFELEGESGTADLICLIVFVIFVYENVFEGLWMWETFTAPSTMCKYVVEVPEIGCHRRAGSRYGENTNWSVIVISRV